MEYDPIAGEKRRFYLKDHLGSTRAVIDENSSPTTLESIIYDSYGKIIKDDLPTADKQNTKEKFTGKEYDTSGFIAGATTGLQLDYFGARYYDPEVGMWTSTDPKGQLHNPYAYSSNPISTIDPDGEWIEEAIGAVVGAYFAVAGYEHNYNPLQWHWNNPKSWEAGILGSVVGSMSASIGGVAGSYVGSVIGGGAGAAVGGAAGGVAGGAIGYTGDWAIHGILTQEWGNGEEYFNGLGKSVLYGGLIGAAAGELMYTAEWAWGNYGPLNNGSTSSEFSEGSDDLGNEDGEYIGEGQRTQFQKDANDIFVKEFPNRDPNLEYGMGARPGSHWWSGKSQVRYEFYQGEAHHTHIPAKNWIYMEHYHPGGGPPSLKDYSEVRKLTEAYHLHISFGLYSHGNLYGYSSYGVPGPSLYDNYYWLMK